MIDPSEVMQSIYAVMQNMNRKYPSNAPLTCEPEFVLFGDMGSFDSLGLANFIVGIEEKIEEQYQCSLGLSEGDFMEFFNSDAVNVREFSCRISHRIQEKTKL